MQCWLILTWHVQHNTHTHTHTHKVQTHTYTHTHTLHMHTNWRTHTRVQCTRPAHMLAKKHKTRASLHNTTTPTNSNVAVPSCCGGRSWRCVALRLCASLPCCGSSWGHVGVRRGSIWYRSLLVLSTNSGNRIVTHVWNSRNGEHNMIVLF